MILNLWGLRLSRATRKYDELDLMKLYVSGSHVGWNKYLSECHDSNNINSLARMRYALQSGMDRISKQNLNDEKMSVFYMRLLKSVEITAKKIIKRIYPNPFDAPSLHGIKKQKPLSALEAKRKRDKELELFLTSSSF